VTSSGARSTLASFNGANGSQSKGALVQGSDGYYYGTTYGGGTAGAGTIFRVNPATTENVTFNTSTDIPIVTSGYGISGSALNVTLGFAPTPGTVLTVVSNTGVGAISGKYTNLTEGGAITTSYNGTTYTFTGTYVGGDGNDMTLTLNTSTSAPIITSANSTTFTYGQNGSFTVAATGSPL